MEKEKAMKFFEKELAEKMAIHILEFQLNWKYQIENGKR